MGILLTILVGAIIGWIAGLIMKTRQSILADIIIGIVGALLGRWFFGSVLHIGAALSAGAFTFLGVLWGVIGAVVLIALIRLIFGGLGSEEELPRAYHEEISTKEAEWKKRKDDLEKEIKRRKDELEK